MMPTPGDRDTHPPRWAERLFGHLIGTRGPWRYIVGDLREEYSDIRERFHWLAADVWYWW